MVIGCIRMRLLLHGCFSLKEKRRILKKIVSLTKNQYNVAVAEIGDNNLWQSAEIGLVTVSNDRRHLNSVVDHILNYIDRLNLAEIAADDFELIDY